MTTYAQTLAAQPDRRRKKEVRDFLFSLFEDMQLKRIVGLAGPHIQDYIEFCKSKGYENGWAGWAYLFTPKDDVPKQQSKSTDFDDVEF